MLIYQMLLAAAEAGSDTTQNAGGTDGSKQADQLDTLLEKAREEQDGEEGTDNDGNKKTPPEGDKGKPDGEDNKNNTEGGKPAVDDNSNGDKGKPDGEGQGTSQNKNPDDATNNSADGKDGADKGKEGEKEDVLKNLKASLNDFFDEEKEWNDDSLKGFMNGVKDLVTAFEAQNARLATMEQFIKEQQDEKMYQVFDEVFDSLGDDMAQLFGKGAARQLDKAFMENRGKVLEKADILAAGYKACGKEFTTESVIKEAATLMAPTLVKVNIQPPKQQKRESQFLQKPSGVNNTDARMAAFEEARKKVSEDEE